MLILGSILSVAIIGTDTPLHYTTPTVALRRYTPSDTPTRPFSKGLEDVCLNFDRSKNSGFPCSFKVGGLDPDRHYTVIGGLSHFLAGTEIDRLINNVSQRNEIHAVSVSSFQDSNLQLLLV